MTGMKALMKRVKKAIKKTRHKLSEEKFEKELDRTIVFLEELQQRINHAPASEPQVAAEPNQTAGGKGKSHSGNGKADGQNKLLHGASSRRRTYFYVRRLAGRSLRLRYWAAVSNPSSA